MYKRILVAVEHSAADEAILAHIVPLATMTGAEVLVVHVADGFAARHFKDLQLRESEEIQADRAYLAEVGERLAAQGLRVSSELAMGDPATELIRLVSERKADLLAMSTHGHRFINDWIRGTTVDKVRHLVAVPVLLLRAHS